MSSRSIRKFERMLPGINNPRPPETYKLTIQEDINQWCEETFGPVATNLSIAVRANEEMAELLTCLNRNDNDQKAIEEAADVVICLYRLVARMRGNLDEAVVSKMEKNKGRTWMIDGNGHGQHGPDKPKPSILDKY